MTRPLKSALFVALVVVPISVRANMHFYEGNAVEVEFLAQWALGAVVWGGIAYVAVFLHTRVRKDQPRK